MPAPTKEDLLLGRLAIKKSVVTEPQVKECLALLQKSGNGIPLGQVLLKKGYISQNNLRALSQHLKGVGNGSSSGARRRPRQGLSTGDRPADKLSRRDLGSLAGQSIDTYLKLAREVGASDLHFQVDAPPFVKLYGELVYLDHPTLTPEDTENTIMKILSDYERKVFKERHDVDFCYVADHGRYRANALRQRKGMDAVFRIIPDKVPTLEDLHLPESLSKFCSFRQGIVLITGPAGCGKSATMAALIDIINRQQNDHIVTVEEPIEYIIDSKSCNVNQRHVYVDTESYARALRSAMRADPDYICVGEMRDLETISMAITAAETGHLVFGTLHTTNATRSVDRIIDVFSPAEQDQIRAMVSESLRGVISQQLIPRADGKGVEPALEVLFATPAVANIVRERKTFQLISVLQTGTKQGMVMMDDSIAELLRKKLITREVAQFYSEDPARFGATVEQPSFTDDKKR